MADRQYSRGEVDAILGRAIERQHGRGELSHSDLVAAAREIGISADAIEAAASEVLSERQVNVELLELRSQQWHGFLRHLVPYLLVNGMLVFLNVVTTRFPWAIFPAVGWGVGLVSHFLAIIGPNPQRLERLLDRKRQRETRRHTRRRLRENASQLENEVEAGLSALLQAAAQRIAGDAPKAAKDTANRARVVDTTGTETGSSNAVGETQKPSRPPGGMHQR